MRLPASVRVAVGATLNFHRDRCFDRAAVIAYFALLSFLPLAVVLVAVGARALGSLDAAERGTELILRNVLYRLPPQLMSEVRALQEGIWSGLTYLAVAVWSSSKVFTKIEGSLDFVFRVEQRRPWAMRKVFAFAIVALLSVLLVTLVLLGGILDTVERFIESTALAALREAPLYQAVNGYVSRYLLPWAVSVLAFVFLYRIMPTGRVPMGAALVGGGVTGTLWDGLKIGFTYYVSNLANYSRTYGALETVVIFLLWVNLSAGLLLWGGELTAILAGARGEEEPEPARMRGKS